MVEILSYCCLMLHSFMVFILIAKFYSIVRLCQNPFIILVLMDSGVVFSLGLS